MTDPRVFFAAQRTHLAWIRTGLALMGFGFVVARFGLIVRELAAHELPPGTTVSPHRSGIFSTYAGTTLLVLGVLVLVFSTVEHVVMIGRYRRNETLAPPRVSLGTLLALLLAALGAVMAAYLVVVR